MDPFFDPNSFEKTIGRSIAFEFEPIDPDLSFEALLSELADDPECVSISGERLLFDSHELKTQPLKWLRSQFSHAERALEWGMGRKLVLKLRRQGWLCTSVSHTAGWVWVAGVREGGIGVDFEDRKRPFSREVTRRVFSPSEIQLGRSPLALWSLKEAGFKASRYLSTFQVGERGPLKSILEVQIEAERISIGGLDGSPVFIRGSTQESSQWVMSVAGF